MVDKIRGRRPAAPDSQVAPVCKLTYEASSDKCAELGRLVFADHADISETLLNVRAEDTNNEMLPSVLASGEESKAASSSQESTAAAKSSDTANKATAKESQISEEEMKKKLLEAAASS